MMPESSARPPVAEFFAGVGLVRLALEQEGCEVLFANDVSDIKYKTYVANFGASEFLCDDIRHVSGSEVPNVDIATASFPCTDLSLAGNRAGLDGKESSMVREFVRVLTEMGDKRPRIVLLENVRGLSSSREGEDLAETIESLNQLDYTCDLLMVDARWFVPQSRPRLFVVASWPLLMETSDWGVSRLRPGWTRNFVDEHPNLGMQAAVLPEPPRHGGQLANHMQRLPPNHELWWDGSRTQAFLDTLSPIQAKRVEVLRRSECMGLATAYRRTRGGKPVWEIRADDIAGCLRTGRGGSSRQALVEVGKGQFRVRWMIAREYAYLQGAPNIDFGQVSEAQARFAMGDGVCVPAVAWLARHYLLPLLRNQLGEAFSVKVYG